MVDGFSGPTLAMPAATRGAGLQRRAGFPQISANSLRSLRLQRRAVLAAPSLRARAPEKSVSAVVVTVVAALAGSSHTRRHRGPDGLKSPSARRWLCTAAAEGDVAGAAELEAEAALLRKEAAELELEQAAQRRANRARLLLGGDPGSRIGVEELRVRLPEVVGLSSISSDEAAELVLAASPSSSTSPAAASLGLDELTSVAFATALDTLVANRERALRERREAETRDAAKEAEDQRAKQTVDDFMSPGEDGDDRGPLIRVVATIAYLLPLADGLQYGIPLLELAPDQLAPLFTALLPLAQLKKAIPFGTLIFFIGMSTLSRNPEFPRLLRFNLQQAVVMDIFVILPLFASSIFGVEVAEGLGFAIFVLLFGAVSYAILFTLLGKVPDGLGVISAATKRNLGGFED